MGSGDFPSLLFEIDIDIGKYAIRTALQSFFQVYNWDSFSSTIVADSSWCKEFSVSVIVTQFVASRVSKKSPIRHSFCSYPCNGFNIVACCRRCHDRKSRPSSAQYHRWAVIYCEREK